MSVWQTIDTAPKNGYPFLAWNKGGNVVVCQWLENDWRFPFTAVNGSYTLFRAGCNGVTHWMPFPEAPE